MIHNPQNIPADRIPKGMRILEKEEVYETPDIINHDLYAYGLYGDHLFQGWYGGSDIITYFTKLPKAELPEKKIGKNIREN
jgi:hypothetical protein